MSDPFERAKTLFFEGIGHFEAGRFESAEQTFADSLALVPGPRGPEVGKRRRAPRHARE